MAISSRSSGNTTTIATVTGSRDSLRLIGTDGPHDIPEPVDEDGQQQNEHDHHFAAPFDSWVDPERFWAANDENWDYGQGNPINPVRQGQRIDIRPNNGTTVTLIAYGVLVIGVSDIDVPLPTNDWLSKV